ELHSLDLQAHPTEDRRPVLERLVDVVEHEDRTLGGFAREARPSAQHRTEPIRVFTDGHARASRISGARRPTSFRPARWQPPTRTAPPPAPRAPGLEPRRRPSRSHAPRR